MIATDVRDLLKLVCAPGTADDGRGAGPLESRVALRGVDEQTARYVEQELGVEMLSVMSFGPEASNPAGQAVEMKRKRASPGAATQRLRNGAQRAGQPAAPGPIGRRGESTRR